MKEEDNMTSRHCERQSSNVERSRESAIRNKGDENVPDARQSLDRKCLLFFLE